MLRQLTPPALQRLPRAQRAATIRVVQVQIPALTLIPVRRSQATKIPTTTSHL